MKDATLERIDPILRFLRAQGTLRETRLASFLLDGRDFIHFHEEPDGVVADVRLARGQVRLPVSTPAEQAELLEQIQGVLSAREGRDS